ncbi:type II secretion system F family protein [Candidatus Micrarchaeota archaeon]|nr:type II secretion system F family protein [Candidatus Micrarchaeota archaeon]
MDFRKAAFPISYEEYISTAVFTTFFVAFEAFALFSTVALLFQYTPIEPTFNQTAVIVTPPEELITAESAFFEMRSDYPVLEVNKPIVFRTYLNSSAAACELSANGIVYTMSLEPPAEICFNKSFAGEGTAQYCITPALSSQGVYNYSYSFSTPTPGLYNYSISCVNPGFSREGTFEAFAFLSNVNVITEKTPAILKVIKKDTEVASITLNETSSQVRLPDGDLTLKAIYKGADSTINAVIPTGQTLFFNYSFGSIDVKTPVNGVIKLTRNDFVIEQPFQNEFTYELGAGEWSYEIKSNGYAPKTGALSVPANGIASLEFAMLKKTRLTITSEPEKPLTSADLYVYVNYTDLDGNALGSYDANITVDGEPAILTDSGAYAYFFNGTAEGTHSVSVFVNKTFYEPQTYAFNTDVTYNEARQSAMEFGLRIALTVFSTFVTVFAFILYPSQRADSRESSIDGTLPFVLSHMSSMANSGISMPEIIRLMAHYCAYDELKKEFSKIHKGMQILGYDLIKSIKVASESTPSKRFSEVLSSLATTIHSGGNITMFLKERADSARLDLTIKAKERTSTMMLLGEIYIILFIAAPIFLAIMLVAMEFVSGSNMPIPPILMLKLSAYVLIPVMTVAFLVYLMKELNTGI